MRKLSFIFMLSGLFLFNVNIFAEAGDTTVVDKTKPWVTDASQLSSPYNECGKDGTPGVDIGNEGHLERMIDGDLTTYWSSDWRHAPTEYGVHYVQISVSPKDVTDQFVFEWASRGDKSYKNGSYNAQMSVYGAPSADATKEECTLLCAYTAPAGKYAQLIMSDTISAKGFTIFRWYVDKAYNIKNNSTKAYVLQFSELQMYPLVLKTARELALDSLATIYNKYVSYLGTFDIGTKPGQYPEDKYEAFEEAVNAADPENPEIEMMTTGQIRDLSQKVITTYNDLKDSRIPMTPFTTGYYYINNSYESFTSTKAIYDDNGTASWKTLEEGNCAFLWYVEYDDSTTNYKFRNCAFNRHITKGAKNATVLLIDSVSDKENEVYMYLYRYDDELGNIVAIRSANSTDSYGFLHPNKHESGMGESNVIVGWTHNISNLMSYWYLQKVDDEEALQMIEDYEPIRNRKAMIAAVHEMMSDGMEALQIAKDMDGEIDMNQPLISDASQFSSDFSDSNDGTNFGNLLDGNVSTFWHSDWHNGTVPAGSHSFEVFLNEELDGGFAYQIMRRSTTGYDHPITIVIYGADNKQSPTWKLLGISTIPYSGTGKTDLSDKFFFVGAYPFFKFVVTETNSQATTPRGYFHMADFQLYPIDVEEKPNSQYNKMGKIATNLEDVISAIPSDDEITIADYTALKEAYDAFMTRFVNPKPLRTALLNAENKAAGIVEGTQPGFWPEDAGVPLNQMIDEAIVYDESGEYTAAQSTAYITRLDSVSEAVFAKAHKIQEGKWYYISFPTEEMYEDYGWDKSPAATVFNEDESIQNPALFGKYATLGMVSNVGTTYTQNEFSNVETGDVVLTDKLYFADEEQIIPDQAMFRFVNLGDSAYAIQNKATGLYLQNSYDLSRPGKDEISLTLQPGLANIEANGYGTNLINIRPMNNAFVGQMHAAITQNRLVTWPATAIGTNSCLMITAAEDVEPDYNPTAFNVKTKLGAFKSFCYPTSIKLSEDSPCVMYTVKMSTEQENTIVLYPIEEAAPGEPFYVLNGDTADYDPEEPVEEVCVFHHGNTFVGEPLKKDALVGCFFKDPVPAGSAYASKNKFVVAQTEMVASLNICYVDAQLKPISEGVYPAVAVEFSTETGIQDALQKVAQPNSGIYSLDGKRVAIGNLATLKHLPAGTYIINGIKVNK